MEAGKSIKNVVENKTINDLDKSTIDYIHQTLLAFEKNYFLSIFDGKEDRLYYSKTTNPGETWYVNDRINKRDTRLRKTVDMDAHFDENVVCFTMIDSKEKLETIHEKFSSHNENIENIKE